MAKEKAPVTPAIRLLKKEGVVLDEKFTDIRPAGFWNDAPTL
ncbi:MAG TPA: hypothetical protein VHR86_07390 [Armatimonadota bacterium]|nr:hypothetical protein [Armatimonadota bacterium]